MIYSLTGQITKLSIDYVVVNVNGVSYKVFLTTSDLSEIVINNNYCLFTYFYINSNYETYLFGFLAEEKLEIFKLLVSVSGVGPKTALNILSGLLKEELINAVKNSDSSVFTKVRGLGKKTALKIIVELSNKFGNIDNISLPSFNSKDLEIVESLSAMGYDKGKIQKILSSLDSNLSENDKVKQIINKLKND